MMSIRQYVLYRDFIFINYARIDVLTYYAYTNSEKAIRQKIFGVLFGGKYAKT